MNRAAILLAGVSALIPLAALGAAGKGAAAAGVARFVAPAGTTLLTRSVLRSLPDGKEIVASRTYALRFVPDGSGYRVEGTQVDCTVDAPPSLRGLAEIENKRVDVGLFPLWLDGSGRIVASKDSGDPERQREAALAVASRFGGASLAPGEKAQATGFVRQLVERGGGLAAWPADLFVAAHGERSEARRLALPDGAEGTVTVATKAGGALASGPATLERTVTTELGNHRSVVRETWSLRPA